MPPRRFHTLLWLIALGLTTAAPARAVVPLCGDTIGPGGKFKLEADVGTCASGSGPGLTVVGPVTLDMDGYRVVCNIGDRPHGIHVVGKKAKIMRGGAVGCDSGLFIEGEGGHTIEDFVAMDSDSDGIGINSDKNKLKRVASTGAGDDGFDVDGSGNKIDDAEAVECGGEGFEIGSSGQPDEGANNKLTRITAVRNGEDGIAIHGSGNQIKDGRFTSNEDDGVDIDGDANKVDKTLASANGQGSSSHAGVEVDGSDNQLTKLIVLDNDETGILLTGSSSGNTVKQAVSLGHARDAVDQNADNNTTCGTNKWQKNRLGSTEANGAPDPDCIPTKRGTTILACGATIGPNAKVTLGADIPEIGTCDTSNARALTITGPATVDMAGFRVRCDPGNRPDGVVLLGKGVKLMNGGATDCDDGLLLEGEGKHKVDGFAAENNGNDGIHVESDKNKLTRVSGHDNPCDGIDFNGSSNKVEDAAAVGNGEQGFEAEGDKNQFKRVIAVDNGLEGFLAEGRNNKMSLGAFITNDDDGVELLTGGNKVDKSVAIRNGNDPSDAGFDSRNDTDDTKGNQLKSNRAWDNPFYGLRSGNDASSDSFQKNTSLGNGDLDAWDQNTDCAKNKWKKNVLGTRDADGDSDPDCIQ